MKYKMALFRFFVFSSIGLFAFFVPIGVSEGESKTILLDHIVSYLLKNHKTICLIFVMSLITYGAISPFFIKKERRYLSEYIFIFFKLLGLLIAGLYVSGLSPQFLMQSHLLPFLFEKLVMSVGMLIPVGSVALAFLISYGLLEFIGVLMRPVMRPLFKTPGYAAIDAVVSFVGSYSLGLLVTNRMYNEGKYSVKEASIVATGFSTVSAVFMVIVAKTTGIISSWNFYFWSTLIITFTVTAIMVRLPPFRGMCNHKKQEEETLKDKNRFIFAFETGIKKAKDSRSIFVSLKDNIKEGIIMAGTVLPSILSIGLLGLLLNEYTPLFDFIGYIFFPFTYILGIPEPLELSSALASDLAEMFLPALILKDADLISRYVAAVCSVSSIIFFSGLVPCILATNIPLKVRNIILVWIIRMVLSIIITTPVAYLAIQQGWLN